MKKPNQPNASFYPHSLHRSVVGRQNKTEAPRKTRLQQLQTENTQLQESRDAWHDLQLRTLKALNQAELKNKKLEGRLATIQQIIDNIEETLTKNAMMHYAIEDYIDILKRKVRILRCDKYSDYALKLPIVWLSDVEKELERLRGTLKNDK